MACPSAAADKSEFPIKIHGFLMGNLAVRTAGERPPSGEGGAFVLGEERLRLDVSRATKGGSGFFLVKGDTFHDVAGIARTPTCGKHTRAAALARSTCAQADRY